MEDYKIILPDNISKCIIMGWEVGYMLSNGYSSLAVTKVVFET